MFAKQIQKLFEDNDWDIGTFLDAVDFGDVKEDYSELIALVGPISKVSEERLGPDYDQLQVVLKLDNHNAFVAFNGSYSSWDGTDFSYFQFYDVRPKQVTVTEYVRT